MKTKLGIILMIAALALSGCINSGNEGNSAQETPAANASPAASGSPPASSPSASAPSAEEAQFAPFGKYADTVTFTLGMTKGDYSKLPEGDTAVDNLYTRYILDKVNVRVEPEWEIDGSTYQQKVSLSIASGDIPDVMIVDRATLAQLVESDLIWDLTEIYAKTASPLLKEQYDSFNGRLLPTATFDGKLMALPGTQIGGAHNMLWIRQDWLDKLGLEPPKTLDDLIAVAQAFIDRDPGGNGPGNTVGLTIDPSVAGIYNSMRGLDTIFGLYDAYPRQWIKDAAGNIIYGSTAPEMKAALQKVHEMYAAGIIDNQFAIRKPEDTNALIVSGRSGLLFGPWYAPYWPLFDAVKENPAADWKPYLVPLDDNGKVHVYTQDPNQQNLVISKKFAFPEAVVKFLNVQNQARYGLDPDALEMITRNLGVDGFWPLNLQVDYEDAVYRTYEAIKRAVETNSDEGLRPDYKAMLEAYKKNAETPRADPSVWAEATARFDGQALTYNDQIEQVHPAFYGRTPTMETKWPSLAKLENETLIKIVIGDMKVDEFDQFVAEWNRLGGKEITAEVVAAANP